MPGQIRSNKVSKEWVPKGKPFPANRSFLLESPLRSLFTRKQRLFRWARLKEDMEILELGPGPGFFTVSLANWVRSGVVHAVDIQEAMIAKLQRKLAKKGVTNVKTYCAPAWQLPLAEETIDAIFAYQVLEEVEDLKVSALELHRVLRPGGILAIFQLKFDFGQEQKGAMKAILPQTGFELTDEVETLFSWNARYTKVS